MFQVSPVRTTRKNILLRRKTTIEIACYQHKPYQKCKIRSQQSSRIEFSRDSPVRRRFVREYERSENAFPSFSWGRSKGRLELSCRCSRRTFDLRNERITRRATAKSIIGRANWSATRGKSSFCIHTEWPPTLAVPPLVRAINSPLLTRELNFL